MSVNKARQGRRFKTKAYKNFEQYVLAMLPRDLEIPEGFLKLYIIWGFSSKLSDNSNPLKPFEDILCKKYGFDDRRIYHHEMKKKVVKKGEEFIEFKIDEYNEDI